jgi:diacylglycerol kinase family enzyme
MTTHVRPLPRAVVLVNRDAGAVLENPTQLESKITEAFAARGVAADLWLVGGRELPQAFRSAAAMQPSLVVIAGGDGTVSGLLPEMMAAEVPLAILPLGTLNLIGRDLGLGGDLDADIAAILDGSDVACDMASVNDRPFHSNAGLGFFTTMARERQRARRRFPLSRKLGFAWAAVRTVLTTTPVGIDYRTPDGVSHAVADAVLVTNNRFFGASWARDKLDEGVIEIHLLRASGLLGRLRAATAVLRGTWRDLPSLTTLAATEVTISRRRRTRMRVAIDGELVRLRNPLQFRVLPRALVVRAPASAEPAARPVL